MSTSKKTYEAVAKQLREEIECPTCDASARSAVRRVAVRLATVFAEDNPRFDTDRFLAAALYQSKHRTASVYDAPALFDDGLTGADAHLDDVGE